MPAAKSSTNERRLGNFQSVSLQKGMNILAAFFGVKLETRGRAGSKRRTVASVGNSSFVQTITLDGVSKTVVFCKCTVCTILHEKQFIVESARDWIFQRENNTFQECCREDFHSKGYLYFQYFAEKFKVYNQFCWNTRLQSNFPVRIIRIIRNKACRMCSSAKSWRSLRSKLICNLTLFNAIHHVIRNMREPSFHARTLRHYRFKSFGNHPFTNYRRNAILLNTKRGDGRSFVQSIVP
jgi:hypothetical protein